MASLGWQGQRTSLAASYSQIVTGGGGLAGAYHLNTANASGRWQVSRTWNAGLSAGYWLYKTVTPFFFGSSSGGHTVFETATIERPLGQHLTVQVGYTAVQQLYGGIAAMSAYPNINRGFVSISYQFRKPLTR
jgi:hypothetical protein